MVYNLHRLHLLGKRVVCPLVEGVVIELDVEEGSSGVNFVLVL